MKSRLLAVSTSAALLLGAAALPAFASAASLYGATGANVSTGVSTGVNVSGDTGAMLNGQTGSSSTSGAATSAGSVTVSVGSTSASTGGNVGATISLTSSDPSVMNFSGSTTPTVSDAMTVRTQDQLSMFAAGMMHSDANIQAVNISNGDVMLSYKKEGHFLGFIPTSITERGDVKADGIVSFSYPWYHFLVSTYDDANAKANLQTQVQSLMSTNASGNLSAQTQAQIMADLYIALSEKS